MIKAIGTVADNLKSHPLAFALVIINVLFLGAGIKVLKDVSVNSRDRFAAQDRLLAQMATDCFDWRKR